MYRGQVISFKPDASDAKRSSGQAFVMGDVLIVVLTNRQDLTQKITTCYMFWKTQIPFTEKGYDVEVFLLVQLWGLEIPYHFG